MRVKYVLMPRHPIDRVAVHRPHRTPRGRPSPLITERFGNAPSATRNHRSHRDAASRISPPRLPGGEADAAGGRVTHDPDRATLVHRGRPRSAREDSRCPVDASRCDRAQHTSPRCRTSRSATPTTRTRSAARCRRGRPACEPRGYYEARANQNASISEDGSVFLFLNLELGPHGQARVRG